MSDGRMSETPIDVYIGLKCQYCDRPIMTKKDIDYISEAHRDRTRVEELKTLLTNLKCGECDRSVSDQVIWNYTEFLAKERDDWVVKTSSEVWPYDTKIRPYKFAVHKSGDYGTFMEGERKW